MQSPECGQEPAAVSRKKKNGVAEVQASAHLGSLPNAPLLQNACAQITFHPATIFPLRNDAAHVLLVAYRYVADLNILSLEILSTVLQNVLDSGARSPAFRGALPPSDGTPDTVRNRWCLGVPTQAPRYRKQNTEALQQHIMSLQTHSMLCTRTQCDYAWVQSLGTPM